MLLIPYCLPSLPVILPYEGDCLAFELSAAHDPMSPWLAACCSCATMLPKPGGAENV